MAKVIRVDADEIEQLAFDYGGTITRNPHTERLRLQVGAVVYVADPQPVTPAVPLVVLAVALVLLGPGALFALWVYGGAL